VRNARRVVQRHHQNHPSASLQEVVDRLQAVRGRVLRAPNLDSLRGIEGDAAHIYFEALAEMVRGDIAFHGRSRRPPRDPVNAALSFGYSLLTTEVEGALHAEGLDPAIGFLHGYHYNRPSLALDIVEEFRQPLVDRTVLAMVNRRELRPEHFIGNPAAGVFLAESGRPILIEAIQDALGIDGGEPGLRPKIRRQAARMRAVIEGGRAYVPFHCA
jgi:CRISPR-associated protein Cas1